MLSKITYKQPFGERAKRWLVARQKKRQRTENSKISYEAGVEPNEGETPARQKKERIPSVLGIKPEAVTSNTLSHRLMIINIIIKIIIKYYYNNHNLYHSIILM